MDQVIGVRFKPAGKIYYFDSNHLDIHLDDGVIVETSRGRGVRQRGDHTQAPGA